jgi:DNA-binding GntR family transcriptional regulator
MTKRERKIPMGDFKPTVLVEEVSRILTDAILDGVFKAGEQLVEADLKEHLQISRSPIREALRDMATKGLVEILPRKGAFVKRITGRDIQEHFPVRSVLEGLAARVAYRRVSQEDLEGMTEALDQMRRAARKSDGRGFWEHHIRFHEIFIRASGNQLLIDLLKTLRMHAMWHRFSYQYYKEDFQKSLANHQTILNLFKSRDADEQEIQRVVADHIEVAVDRFLAYLETQQVESP